VVYEREHARYLKARARAKEWILTKEQRKALDKRIRSIAHSGLIPFSLAPCKTIPGYKKAKSATWISFLRSCVPYAMYGVPLISRTSIVGLCGTLSKIILTTCDYTPGDEEATTAAKMKIKELKTELTRAVCIFERDVPESELSYFVHEIIHLCDFLYRWNNVRNYWCFLVERFVGYVKGFVTNRHLVLESLVRANRSFTHGHFYIVCAFCVLQARSYCTGILVRSIEPRVRRGLLQRLQAQEAQRETGHAVLREFVKMSEKAPHEQTLLASLKGGGTLVCPSLTTRISTRKKLGQGAGCPLRNAAYIYFRANQEFRYQIKLGEKYHVLRTHVKLNGRFWRTNEVVSFVYGAPNAARASVRLGVIMEYLVVRFWPANEGGDSENLEGRTTVFVKLYPFAQAGVTVTYGNGDGFTSFRVKKSSAVDQTPVIVHSDALMTLYCKVPDAALDNRYSWCVPVALAFAD
jgi:hypothetical protein